MLATYNRSSQIGSFVSDSPGSVFLYVLARLLCADALLVAIDNYSLIGQGAYEIRGDLDDGMPDRQNDCAYSSTATQIITLLDKNYRPRLLTCSLSRCRAAGLVRALAPALPPGIYRYCSGAPKSALKQEILMPQAATLVAFLSRVRGLSLCDSTNSDS